MLCHVGFEEMSVTDAGGAEGKKVDAEVDRLYATYSRKILA